MFELPSQPQFQPIIKILDDGIKLFLRCFTKVLPLALADAVLSVLFQVYVMANLAPPDSGILITVTKESLIYIPLYMVAMLVLQTAIFYRIGTILTQSDRGNFDALLEGVKQLLPIFLATWLYTFLFGVGLIVIIPGVILAVSLRFFTPLILFDKATVFESLHRSHRLVWGNWWHTAIVLMIPLLISASVGILASTVVEQILVLSATFAQEQINLYMQITYLTVDKLLTPLFYAIMLVLYYDLKRRSKQPERFEKQLIA